LQHLTAFCHVISANQRITDDKVATACGLEEQEIEIRSPDKADLHFLQGLQTDSMAHSASYSMRIKSLTPENKADGTRSWPLTIQCRRQE